MKLFRSRAFRYTAIALSAAILLGLAEAAQVHMGMANVGRPLSWSRSLSATMPSWFVMAALIPFAIWVARRFPLETLTSPKGIIAHLLAAGVFASLFLVLAGWLSDYVFYHPKTPMPFMTNTWRLFSNYFVGELLQYAGIVGIYFAFDYSRRYREKERAASELALKATRLEASLTRSNLEALRMQLNPHFLFNALNSIAMLTRAQQNPSAVRMLAGLGDLLRYVLEAAPADEVTLEQEITFLKQYLEIETVRFRDRLRVVFDVADETLPALLPNLLLQPIVENALKHGVGKKVASGVITIAARRLGDRLVVQVSDDGPGLSTAPGRTGVGLGNARERLEQMYGAQCSLDLRNGDFGGAVASVTLPFHTASTALAGSAVVA